MAERHDLIPEQSNQEKSPSQFYLHACMASLFAIPLYSKLGQRQAVVGLKGRTTFRAGLIRSQSKLPTATGRHCLLPSGIHGRTTAPHARVPVIHLLLIAKLCQPPSQYMGTQIHLFHLWTLITTSYFCGSDPSSLNN